MNTQEKSILLRVILRQKGQFFHAEVVAEETHIQLHETGGYSHPRDAVFAALKSVAVENNFTGCLNLDTNNQGVKYEN